MSDPIPPPLAAPYRDRRVGLLVFGVLEILLGGLFILMIPLSVVGQISAARQMGQSFDPSPVVAALLMFAFLAGSLIWLGIGSILARRWARALLLILGWTALGAGLLGLGIVIPTLGGLEETLRQQGQQMPPGALLITKVITIAMLVLMYIVIPGAVILFYGSRHVKLTCEARDPVQRWTDRCPLPVIAMCMFQLLGVVSWLLLPQFGSAFPIFGLPLTGWWARLVWFVFAGVSLYAAWGFYHLRSQAWWVYTVTTLGFWLSYTVSLITLGLEGYYRASGFSGAQIDQLLQSPAMHNDALLWISVSMLIPYLGFLLYLRRYFPGFTRRPAAA